MCLPQQDEEKQKLLPVFGSTVFTLYVAVKSVAIQYSHWEGYSKGICGICAIKVTATDTPLLFPMHHQLLRILTYLFIYFLLSASTALWYAKILIAVLSFSLRSACKHSIQFYLCPMPFGAAYCNTTLSK